MSLSLLLVAGIAGTTFGLFRADQPSAVKMDETGKHAVLISSRGEQKASEGTNEMKSFRANFKLNDPKLLTRLSSIERRRGRIDAAIDLARRALAVDTVFIPA